MHAVEHGGLEQEAADCCGQPQQHLVDQVVHDGAVVAGEGPDEGGDVRAPLHRTRRQLEPGDPALGARFQGGDVVGREAEAHRLREKGGGVGRGEA